MSAQPCEHEKPGAYWRLDLIDQMIEEGRCCIHGYRTDESEDYRRRVEARHLSFAEIRRDVENLR